MLERDDRKFAVTLWATGLALSLCLGGAVHALTKPLDALKSTPVTVGTVAARVVSQCHITVHVCSATTCPAASPAPCYIGGQDVTTANGLPLPAGTTYSVDTKEAYLISTAPTCLARVLTGRCSP